MISFRSLSNFNTPRLSENLEHFLRINFRGFKVSMEGKVIRSTDTLSTLWSWYHWLER